MCGVLRIAFREYDDEYYAANVAQALARHPDLLKPVTPDEARELFPPLGEIRNALFNPRGQRVDGRAITAAIDDVGGRLGVERRHETAREIEVRADRVRAVYTASARIRASTS